MQDKLRSRRPPCRRARPPRCACACSPANHSASPSLISQGEVPAQCTATLPPEVERLMRFTDAPQLEEEQPQGWLRFWRYQGP